MRTFCRFYISSTNLEHLPLEYASDELRADEEVVLVPNLKKFECPSSIKHIQKHINSFSESYFSDSLRFLLSASGEEKGLRTQFITLFLKSEGLLAESGQLKNTQVLREYPLQSNGSVKKLDLLFLNLDSNLIVGIENKFLGEDSAKQLDTYYKLLNEQFYPTHNVYLVYLTLDGRKPKFSKNAKIINLSWLGDILPMIKNAYANISHKNRKIEDLVKYLEDISSLKTLSGNSKDLSHPFDIEKFAEKLHGFLNSKEWTFVPTKLEFTRNNTTAKNSKHKFTIILNQSACVLKSKHIKVYLPFALNGQQINYLITNFLDRMNTKLADNKPIKLDEFFNIPYKEYQIYRYFCGDISDSNIQKAEIDSEVTNEAGIIYRHLFDTREETIDSNTQKILCMFCKTRIATEQVKRWDTWMMKSWSMPACSVCAPHNQQTWFT